jgi:ornithine cyclodeaminase/alanine dehydrogenase-like protein (mu-crystallin family)
MQIISAATCRKILSFPVLIESLRQMFISGCTVPLRQTHSIAANGTVLIMPAWLQDQFFGIKTVTVFPDNRAHGIQTLHSTYTLFDGKTGQPLALMDGDEITSRRTAAASALAASFLAHPDASRLLLVGAGNIASLMTDAMTSVRPIQQVRVWSRDGRSSAALAARLRAAHPGLDAAAAAAGANGLAAAVAAADIISCATPSTAPLVRGEWLRPGAHLDLVGGFSPAMREADAACFARARVVVDTDEALAKAGDLLLAAAEGAFAPAGGAGGAGLDGTLADLCAGRRAGRAAPEEVTVFKSVGTALEDLAAAMLVHRSYAASPAPPPPPGDASR